MAGSENVVAVLGTGIMGAAMARNLLGAGMEVRVWNRSREKAEGLAQDGASVVENPGEAIEGAGFVVTMLADADVIEEVLEEETLSALAEGGLWLQMSTVGIEGNEKLAALAFDAGVTYVDAPCLARKVQRNAGR